MGKRSRSNMRVLSFCVYFCLVAAVFCGQKKNGKGGNGGDGGDGGNGGNGGNGGGGGCSIAYRTECQQSSQNECSTTYVRDLPWTKEERTPAGSSAEPGTQPEERGPGDHRSSPQASTTLQECPQANLHQQTPANMQACPYQPLPHNRVSP